MIYPSEQKEQNAVVSWAATRALPDVYRDSVVGRYLFAIPNGGRRNAREAARLRNQGVKAGVSDMFFAFSRHGYRGVWIEMKVQAGAFGGDGDRRRSVSPEQRDWILLMRGQGFAAAACWGADEAKALLDAYLDPRILVFKQQYEFQVGRA